MKEFSNDAYFMLFSTLANRTRLAIIDVLKDDAKTVSEISSALRQDADVISQNLKPLVKCAVVLSTDSKKGKRYFLNKEFIEPLSGVLAFHVEKYCPGSKECVPGEKLREYMKAEAAKTTYIEHE
jgi:DNA-binding transcriptional ArsR family regulator